MRWPGCHPCERDECDLILLPEAPVFQREFGYDLGMSPDCTTKIIHPAWARDALGLPNHDPLSWAEMASLKRGSDRIAEWAMGRATMFCPRPALQESFPIEPDGKPPESYVVESRFKIEGMRYTPRDYDRPGVCDVREPMLEDDRRN